MTREIADWHACLDFSFVHLLADRCWKMQHRYTPFCNVPALERPTGLPIIGGPLLATGFELDMLWLATLCFPPTTIKDFPWVMPERTLSVVPAYNTTIVSTGAIVCRHYTSYNNSCAPLRAMARVGAS